jgi:hypothetical protein
MRPRTRALVIVLVLTASLLTPPAAPSQTAAAQPRDWAALKAVEPGSKLAVKLKGGKTVEGRLGGVSDAALSMSVHDKATDFGREDVLSVYRVKGKSAAKATLIGMGVGAGVGAAVGASGDDDFLLSRSEGAAALGALGAAAGALVGYAVGRGRSKRVLVYEAGP